MLTGADASNCNRTCPETQLDSLPSLLCVPTFLTLFFQNLMAPRRNFSSFFLFSFLGWPFTRHPPPDSKVRNTIASRFRSL
jgi:hypothetical protein